MQLLELGVIVDLAMFRPLALALPLLLLGACVSTANVRRGLERQWAADVLLGAESGGSRQGVVRWRKPVQFLVVDAAPRFRVAIDSAFAQLQQALAGVHLVELEYVRGWDQRIGQQGFVTVFATAPAEAAGLAQRLGAMTPGADADGWFTISWNQSFELTRAVVFINPALEQRWLRHTTLEEMFQTLGPSNDSGLIADSLVYESDREFGSSEQLGRVDREVLRMLYAQLSPGSSQADIRHAMQSSWRYASE